jgi:murein DD-endopeptidase MepM/ murein hydrolase activator NlpD
LKNDKNIESKFSAFKKKHRLSFSDQHTYDEKWSFKVSSLNLLSLFILYAIFIIFFCLIIIKFTPLKYLFIGQENQYEINQSLKLNNAKIDSLEIALNNNNSYIINLQSILNGEDKLDTTNLNQNELGENFQPHFNSIPEDSILRNAIENSEHISSFSTTLTDEVEFYLPPIQGIISQSFNPKIGHYGVDIVGHEEEPIKATLKGKIIFSNWTSNQGHVIIIQHNNSLISIYKHNSSLLKKEGQTVEAGDPIAIIGNSGEYTDGSHLHFELWLNQTAINPQEYISF